VISWLPAAHIAERNAHHYLPIVFGLQITCCDDPRQVLSYLPEVRPSWFFAVPRIWEKLKSGLEAMIAGQPQEQSERSRAALAPEFADRYKREVLDRADLERIVLELPERGLAALLCVERDPEACHRSLIAERLAADHGLRVRHLRP